VLYRSGELGIPIPTCAKLQGNNHTYLYLRIPNQMRESTFTVPQAEEYGNAISYCI